MRRLVVLMAPLLLAACPGPGPAPPAAVPLPGPPAAVATAAPAQPSPAHDTLAVEAAACRAFAGAGAALTAHADPALAPALPVGRRHDVALGATPGYLTLAVPRAGEWSVFLGRAHFLLLLDPTDAVMFSVEGAGPPAGCAGIARHLVFELQAGVAYRLELAAAEAPGDSPLAVFVGETHP